MAKIIDGAKIAGKINARTGRLVKVLAGRGRTVKLAVALVGDHPASLKYVDRKARMAKKLGIELVLKRFPVAIRSARLAVALKKIQSQIRPAGLILQLPLPSGLYCSEVLDAIEEKLDVDFLSAAAQGRLICGLHDLEPPTPGAVMTILRELKINLTGKNVTVVGMGRLVGRPLVMLLDGSGASVTTCNSRTKNLAEKCRGADILISAVGKKGLIRGDMVKPGAVVIDAGFTFAEGKSFGDADWSEVEKVAGFATPTPGGIGPITVALLLANTVRRAAAVDKHHNRISRRRRGAG